MLAVNAVVMFSPLSEVPVSVDEILEYEGAVEDALEHCGREERHEAEHAVNLTEAAACVMEELKEEFPDDQPSSVVIAPIPGLGARPGRVVVEAIGLVEEVDGWEVDGPILRAIVLPAWA